MSKWIEVILKDECNKMLINTEYLAGIEAHPKKDDEFIFYISHLGPRTVVLPEGVTYDDIVKIVKDLGKNG